LTISAIEESHGSTPRKSLYQRQEKDLVQKEFDDHSNTPKEGKNVNISILINNKNWRLRRMKLIDVLKEKCTCLQTILAAKMAIPVTQLAITFCDLNYHVDTPPVIKQDPLVYLIFTVLFIACLLRIL
jgi:hypothetical protein